MDLYAEWKDLEVQSPALADEKLYLVDLANSVVKNIETGQPID